MFDHWCWLGTVKSLNAAVELARSAPRVFEPDEARLAVQALSDRSPWTLEIVALDTVVPAWRRDSIFSSADYDGLPGRMPVNASLLPATPPPAPAPADTARENA